MKNQPHLSRSLGIVVTLLSLAVQGFTIHQSVAQVENSASFSDQTFRSLVQSRLFALEPELKEYPERTEQIIEKVFTNEPYRNELFQDYQNYLDLQQDATRRGAGFQFQSDHFLEGTLKKEVLSLLENLENDPNFLDRANQIPNAFRKYVNSLGIPDLDGKRNAPEKNRLRVRMSRYLIHKFFNDPESIFGKKLNITLGVNYIGSQYLEIDDFLGAFNELTSVEQDKLILRWQKAIQSVRARTSFVSPADQTGVSALKEVGKLQIFEIQKQVLTILAEHHPESKSLRLLERLVTKENVKTYFKDFYREFSREEIVSKSGPLLGASLLKHVEELAGSFLLFGASIGIDVYQEIIQRNPQFHLQYQRVFIEGEFSTAIRNPKLSEVEQIAARGLGKLFLKEALNRGALYQPNTFFHFSIFGNFLGFEDGGGPIFSRADLSHYFAENQIYQGYEAIEHKKIALPFLTRKEQVSVRAYVDWYFHHIAFHDHLVDLFKESRLMQILQDKTQWDILYHDRTAFLSIYEKAFLGVATHESGYLIQMALLLIGDEIEIESSLLDHSLNRIQDGLEFRMLRQLSFSVREREAMESLLQRFSNERKVKKIGPTTGYYLYRLKQEYQEFMHDFSSENNRNQNSTNPGSDAHTQKRGLDPFLHQLADSDHFFQGPDQPPIQAPRRPSFEEIIRTPELYHPDFSVPVDSEIFEFTHGVGRYRGPQRYLNFSMDLCIHPERILTAITKNSPLPLSYLQIHDLWKKWFVKNEFNSYFFSLPISEQEEAIERWKSLLKEGYRIAAPHFDPHLEEIFVAIGEEKLKNTKNAITNFLEKSSVEWPESKAILFHSHGSNFNEFFMQLKNEGVFTRNLKLSDPLFGLLRDLAEATLFEHFDSTVRQPRRSFIDTEIYLFFTSRDAQFSERSQWMYLMNEHPHALSRGGIRLRKPSGQNPILGYQVLKSHPRLRFIQSINKETDRLSVISYFQDTLLLRGFEFHPNQEALFYRILREDSNWAQILKGQSHDLIFQRVFSKVAKTPEQLLMQMQAWMAGVKLNLLTEMMVHGSKIIHQGLDQVGGEIARIHLSHWDTFLRSGYLRRLKGGESIIQSQAIEVAQHRFFENIKNSTVRKESRICNEALGSSTGFQQFFDEVQLPLPSVQ